MPYRVENIVRKGEIACYKQFLLFSQCFPQVSKSLARQNASLCGTSLTNVKDLSRFKEFAEDRLNVIKMMKYVLGVVGNIIGN